MRNYTTIEVTMIPSKKCVSKIEKGIEDNSKINK